MNVLSTRHTAHGSQNTLFACIRSEFALSAWNSNGNITSSWNAVAELLLQTITINLVTHTHKHKAQMPFGSPEWIFCVILSIWHSTKSAPFPPICLTIFVSPETVTQHLPPLAPLRQPHLKWGIEPRHRDHCQWTPNNRLRIIMKKSNEKSNTRDKLNTQTTSFSSESIFPRIASTYRVFCIGIWL